MLDDSNAPHPIKVGEQVAQQGGFRPRHSTVSGLDDPCGQVGYQEQLHTPRCFTALLENVPATQRAKETQPKSDKTVERYRYLFARWIGGLNADEGYKTAVTEIQFTQRYSLKTG